MQQPLNVSNEKHKIKNDNLENSILNVNLWSTYYLKDISLINPKTADLPDLFNYIDLESVESGILKFKKIISKEEAPSRAKRVLSKEDILFQTVRPYQKNNLFFNFDDMKYVASTGYAQIRAKDFIYPLFLYYLLHTDKFVNNVLARCTGTSYPSINSNDLKKIKVKIPNLITQQKIGNFLTLIDEKIILLEKKHKNMEKYSNQLLNEIINHKYSVPNSNNEWNHIKLNKIGSSFNGLTGKTKEDFGKGDSKYITYTSIFNNYIQDLSNLDSVIVCEDESQNPVQKGDIFFTTSSETLNEVGMSSVILEDISNCYLNSFCFGYRLNSLENFNPLFLVYYFRSFKFRKELYKIAQGSTRFNLSKKELLKSEIEIPNINEQNYYVNLINNCFKIKEEVNNEIKQISKFKKGLLQKMFV